MYTWTHRRPGFLVNFLEYTMLLMIAAKTIFAQYVPGTKQWKQNRTNSYTKIFGNVTNDIPQCGVCHRQDCPAEELIPLFEHLSYIAETNFSLADIQIKLASAIVITDCKGMLHNFTALDFFQCFLFYDLHSLSCRRCAVCFVTNLAIQVEDQESLSWTKGIRTACFDEAEVGSGASSS